jgi:signal transduction histidine kinase
MNRTPLAPSMLARRVAAFGPAIIALILGGAILVGVERARAERGRVTHTTQVLATLDTVVLRLVDAETGVRGYFITGDSSYLEPYRHAEADVRNAIARLRSLMEESARQQRRLDTLSQLVQIRFVLLDSGVTRRRTNDVVVLGPPATSRGRVTMDNARRLIAAMSHDESDVLKQSSDIEAARTRFLFVVVAVGSIAAALLGLLANGLLSRFAVEQSAMADELGRANAALRDRAAELGIANHAKMQFLTSMSHELRTPLNAIDGYAELLSMGLRGPVSSQQQVDLARVRGNARYLAGLINDILNFAKLEAGQFEVQFSAVPVHEVLAGIESLIAPQASGKGVDYVYVPCDPSIIARADPERVQQVVLNLVANAVKFTDAGGAVTLSSEIEAEQVCIRVADTGRGIPAEKLGAIFDPFVQVDRRLNTEGLQGAGLGLAISRDLVTQMGGTMTVESAVGRGSTFSFTLPLSLQASASPVLAP